MMIFIYSLVVILATTIGAIAGLGGGVIIKPCFDLLGYHNAAAIGVYSSIAVFVMCLVSIYKQARNGASFNIKVVLYISLGSVIGGIVGENIFNVINGMFANPNTIKGIQALLLGITLIIILLYTLNKQKVKTFHIKNPLLILSVGLFLGIISVFLGIGGGPLNIALLTICFSYDMKESVIYSIATIFFSQISKLTQVYIANQFTAYDLSPVLYICIAAVIGGYLGTRINQKLNNAQVEKVYLMTMGCLLLLSCFNVYSGFFK